MQHDYIDKATLLWTTGRSLEAGRTLYEHIPNGSRPGWAANILGLCRTLTKTIAEVDAVYEIALDATRWPEAYDAFQRVRKLTLQAEKIRVKDPIYVDILALAENTAKVTYNSSGAPAPFDRDAGWWIVHNLRTIVDDYNDDDFASEAWSAAITIGKSE